MRVLVTGSAGATGAHMMAFLAKLPDVEPIGLEHRDTDLCDYARTFTAVRRAAPDAVIHLAARANVAQSTLMPAVFYETNITGTDNLLRSLAQLKIAPRFLMVSSCEVYGNYPFPIDETKPHAPVNPYGFSKCGQELLGAMAWRTWRLPVVTSRLFNVINPARADLFSSAFARQIARIEAKKESTLWHGNLDSARYLMDVRDVVSAYWHVLWHGEPGAAYNIAGRDRVTVLGMLNMLTSQARCPIPRGKKEELLRANDIPEQIPNTEKFDALGWKPKYKLEESVEYLMQYHREKEGCE